MRKIAIILGIFSLVLSTWAQTVIFQSDMGSGEISNFTAVQSPDTSIQFGYNWGSDALDASTGYSTVPASPNGDTTGLRIEVNNTDDATDYEEAVTVFANTLCPSDGYYDVEFDCFIAYTLPLILGGTGGTEHVGLVVQASGTKICTIRDNALDNVDPGTPGAVGGEYIAQDGLAFGYSGDTGEAGSDIYCFMPSARTGGGNANRWDGQVGSWSGTNSLPWDGTDYAKEFDTVDEGDDGPYYHAALSFPAQRTTDASDRYPGYLWNTVKAEVRVDRVTFYVNDVTFVTVTSSLTDLAAGIIATDPYSSFSNPISESYMLIDNFKITDHPMPLGAEHWSIYR